VFASADMLHINQLASKKWVTEPAVIAKNKLVVVVSKTTEMKLNSLADLSKPGLRLVMASKQVPLAAYTRQFLKNADQSGAYGPNYSLQVLANTVSEEPDARMVMLKITLGEGDAAVVYASDITTDVKNKVKTIAIADPLNVVAEYGVALVKSGTHLDAAQAFYRLLLSAQGQAIFVKNGLIAASVK
jgi:molybdate transport system substrate-binding protein